MVSHDMADSQAVSGHYFRCLFAALISGVGQSSSLGQYDPKGQVNN